MGSSSSRLQGRVWLGPRAHLGLLAEDLGPRGPPSGWGARCWSRDTGPLAGPVEVGGKGRPGARADVGSAQLFTECSVSTWDGGTGPKGSGVSALPGSGVPLVWPGGIGLSGVDPRGGVGDPPGAPAGRPAQPGVCAHPFTLPPPPPATRSAPSLVCLSKPLAPCPEGPRNPGPGENAWLPHMVLSGKQRQPHRDREHLPPAARSAPGRQGLSGVRGVL